MYEFIYKWIYRLYLLPNTSLIYIINMYLCICVCIFVYICVYIMVFYTFDIFLQIIHYLIQITLL